MYKNSVALCSVLRAWSVNTFGPTGLIILSSPTFWVWCLVSWVLVSTSLKLKYNKSVMPSNHLILCRPLLLPPSIFPSIKIFFKESVRHIRWPKDWCFSFSISPSNEYSGLISFRMDYLDFLAVQGTLKSILQHLSPKAWIFWHVAFFIVQLSYPYMTTGKNIALTRQTFVGKVKSRDITLPCYIQIKFISFYWVNNNKFCYLLKKKNYIGD